MSHSWPQNKNISCFKHLNQWPMVKMFWRGQSPCCFGWFWHHVKSTEDWTWIGDGVRMVSYAVRFPCNATPTGAMNMFINKSYAKMNTDYSSHLVWKNTTLIHLNGLTGSTFVKHDATSSDFLDLISSSYQHLKQNTSTNKVPWVVLTQGCFWSEHSITYVCTYKVHQKWNSGPF